MWPNTRLQTNRVVDPTPRTASINRADAPYPAYFRSLEVTPKSLRELAPFLVKRAGDDTGPGIRRRTVGSEGNRTGP